MKLFKRKNLLVVLLITVFALTNIVQITADDLSGHLEVGTLAAEGTPTYGFTEKVNAEFLEMHPDLEIELTFANTKARAFMEQRWRTGNPPDIDYFVFNAQVPSTYEFTEHLLDLTPYLEADPEWGESFTEASQTITNLDGEIYGAITDAHVIALYYNKGYFDEFGLEPPKDWDEFLNVCKVLKENDIDPITVTGTYTPYMGMWTDYLMTRHVGYDVAKEAIITGTMNEHEGLLEAAKKIQYLVDNEYIMEGFEGTDFTPAQMRFFQGDTGMILMGTWLTSEMAGSIPEDFEIGITAFPEITGSDVDQSQTLSHNNIMSINKDSDNLEAAVEYLKFFTSKDVQTRRAAETSLISAVKDVPVPEGTYGLADVVENAGSLHVRYFGFEFEPDRNTAYYNEVAKLFFGEQTAEEFIENADEAMAALN